MLTFKKFIAEDSVDPIAQVAHFVPKRTDKLLAAVKTLRDAAAAKHIWNADYNDAKDQISMFLRYLSDSIHDEEFVPRLRSFQAAHQDAAWSKIDSEPWYSDSNLDMQGAKKFAAHWSKHSAEFPKHALAAAAVLELKALLVEVKPYIEKGRKPADPKPGAFVKPLASYDAQKQVMGFLQEAAAQVRTEYETQVTASFLKKLAEAVAAVGDQKISEFKDLLKRAAGFDGTKQHIVQAVFKRSGSSFRDPFVLEPNAEAIVRKMALRMVDEILQQFVAKNTSKIALVFQKKGAAIDHKIIENRVRNNVLENRMSFKFADNSSFTIYSKVEWSYSSKGKEFIRVPTRFTDVVFADGTRMRAPSEEQVIKDF